MYYFFTTTGHLCLKIIKKNNFEFLMEDPIIKYYIIKKMARKGYWGHRLINLSDLIKSVPSHLRGKAKELVEELFKDGFLNRKPGNRGEFRYSLKSELRNKVEEVIWKKRYF